jgi:hypothetical protein
VSEPGDPKDPGASDAPPASIVVADASPDATAQVYEQFASEPAPPLPPIAPPTDDDLREAVGVARREKPERAKTRPKSEDGDRDRDDDHDDHDGTPLTPEQRARRRKMWLTLSFSLVFGLIVIAFVFLGRANGSRLVMVCTADKISAEEGRGFPPWGTRALDGPEWAPIAIPPQAECQTRETESPDELERWYLDALIAQARAKLSARDVATGAGVDDAEKLLRQALLLARPPERHDRRDDIDRLLGNVVYWRANAKIKAASDALAEAAKLYDEATAKKPIDLRDSAAWGDYARELVDEIHLGPEALRPPVPLGAAPLPAHEPAPQGVALPVYPPDAQMGAPITPPDAGVPSGGVLL